MRAEQKIECCQEPHLSRHSQATAEAPNDDPRPVESSEQSSPVSNAPAPCVCNSQQSTIHPPQYRYGGRVNSPAIHQLRSRLFRCLKSRVNEPDWELLLQQTEYYAAVEIRCGYYWRDGYRGVVPGGYDASSVAAEALAELFTEQPENGLVLVPRMLRVALKKRARKIINRLHHRMENKIMRNTDDFVPFLTDDGETISVVEKVPAPDRTSRTSLEILIEKEDAIRFAEFKAQIRAVLAQERVLLRLFECFCADICKPKDQARKLKLRVRHIQDLQRRLRRKLAAHGYVPSSWRSRI